VTRAKLAASAIRGAKSASDCVLAIVKKLQLPKGTKVTAPIKITIK
jgi:hypothetical protein